VAKGEIKWNISVERKMFFRSVHWIICNYSKQIILIPYSYSSQKNKKKYQTKQKIIP
jgi:hypothetical protein